ncbi:hypothetical protein SUGI_0067610 [Cryptomeria japonica]|nr:hypothetical protein SUGI_0067610 [Cryptomeria japonica]
MLGDDVPKFVVMPSPHGFAPRKCRRQRRAYFTHQSIQTEPLLITALQNILVFLSFYLWKGLAIGASISQVLAENCVNINTQSNVKETCAVCNHQYTVESRAVNVKDFAVKSRAVDVKDFACQWERTKLQEIKYSLSLQGPVSHRRLLRSSSMKSEAAKYQEMVTLPAMLTGFVLLGSLKVTSEETWGTDLLYEI